MKIVQRCDQKHVSKTLEQGQQKTVLVSIWAMSNSFNCKTTKILGISSCVAHKISKRLREISVCTGHGWKPTEWLFFFFFFHVFICYCMENGSNSVEHINAWAHEHFLKSLSAIMGSETDWICNRNVLTF